MDLERKDHRLHTSVQIVPILVLLSLVLASAGMLSAAQKPGLIRDTEVADAKATEPEVKARDPIQCEKNINVGDYYYKQKNYEAAIRRYLEAIEYQADSARAYDALARAYQKNDEPAKAIAAYRKFIESNPDSPKLTEIRTKLAKLEKTAK